MNKNKIILGISFLIVGIFSFLRYFGITSISNDQLFGTAILFYSIPTVYFSLGGGRRDKLVWATLLFCVGVIFVVRSYFEILDTRGIIFTSILFSGGAALFLLFIENMKVKIFLAASLTLILLTYLSITWFKNFGLFEAANKIGNLFEVFWPVILIVLGIIIFVNRKR